MAYRFFTGQVTSDADNASMIIAGNGDSLTFTRSATYVAAGEKSSVVSIRNGVAIAVDGQLYSADGPTIVGKTALSAFNDIRVGATGSVVSAGGAAMNIAGQAMTLANRGEIAGALFGVRSTAADTTIVNDGAIGGRQAVYVIAQQATVANHGSIAGVLNGVYLEGGQEGYEPLELTNSGTISGRRGAGVNILSNTDAQISNTGVIDGRIGVQFSTTSLFAGGTRTFVNDGVVSGRFAAAYGSEAADRMVNHGTLAGAVYLNAGDDYFDSRTGTVSGRVEGGDGNDQLIGSSDAAAILDGGAGNDLVYGGDADDVLFASAGVDLVDGGAGRDIYSFRGEFAAVDFRLWQAGTYADTFVSIEGVEGGSGNDYLAGNDEANWLYGGVGNDQLEGRGGADLMAGGAGDDVYYVENARDRVTEKALEGTDIIYLDVAGTRYVMPDNVENLGILALGGAIVDGNAGGNVISGGPDGDLLNGKLGADRLFGANGADRFVFSTAPSAANADTIVDFFQGQDKVQLSLQVYQTGTPSGQQLSAANFVQGTAALDENDFIIYDRATQSVFYDADGTGGIQKVLIFRFDSTTLFSAADIVMV